MKRITLVMAIIAVLLMSCGNGKQSYQTESKTASQDVGIPLADSVALPNQNDKIEETKNKEPNKPKVPENTDWDKKIIKTADIVLQAKTAILSIMIFIVK